MARSADHRRVARLRLDVRRDLGAVAAGETDAKAHGASSDAFRGDLKQAVASALDSVIAPVRGHFEGTKLLQEVMGAVSESA